MVMVAGRKAYFCSNMDMHLMVLADTEATEAIEIGALDGIEVL
jgi:hypothetical protein